MTLYPEQVRALGYARKRGTEAALTEIRARVAGTYAEIENLVGSLAPEVVRRRTEVSAWSVHEVVYHLVQSDGPAAPQLRDLLAGNDCDEPIAAGLQSPEPFAVGWGDLLERFRHAHRDIVALLDRASDDIPAAATAAVQMVVKCAGPDGVLVPVHWVERFDWKAYAILLHAHTREHIAQVNRILAALAAPAPTSSSG